MDEAYVTEQVKLKERLKDFAEERGVKLTYLSFNVKACVFALKKFPVLNSNHCEKNNEIILFKNYNIGVATATDYGLIVPIIHNCEKKSILEIAKKIQEKKERARNNKLKLEDLEGGTFSITNIGAIGGLFSFPVINHPQVVILGVHSINNTL